MMKIEIKNKWAEEAANSARAAAVTHPITGLSMHEINEENARLTANNAALLEALQNLEDAGQKCFEDILATGSINRTRGQVYREAKEQARAAIKTATGKATP
jgi:ribosomal protein L15